MKFLVTPPTKSHETVVIQKNFWSKPMEFCGQCLFSNVAILSDETLFLGERIKSFTLGGYTMYGVLPLSVKDGIYQCSIDYFEMEQYNETI